jgi:hypothetical protein
MQSYVLALSLFFMVVVAAAFWWAVRNSAADVIEKGLALRPRQSGSVVASTGY